jgi:hypothetical protein
MCLQENVTKYTIPKRGVPKRDVSVHIPNIKVTTIHTHRIRRGLAVEVTWLTMLNSIGMDCKTGRFHRHFRTRFLSKASDSQELAFVLPNEPKHKEG